MPQRLSIRIPATSANLGCLFDCGGLALDLHLTLRIQARDDARVNFTYRGVTPERIPSGDSNLLVATIRRLLETWGSVRGYDLEIDNQIPVGAGLGSSAAAIVGALVCAHWLVGMPMDDEAVLALATRLEGHPDNVAAAWHGGFTIAVQEEEHVWAFSSPVPESLGFVVVVPDYALPTSEARGALPDQYSRADAVHNLQRAVMVAAQFASGRVSFENAFFDDRFHQPYRTSLVPGLAEALSLRRTGLLGLALSGAGPTLLAIVDEDAAGNGEAIRDVLSRHGIDSRAYLLTADNQGASGGMSFY